MVVTGDVTNSGTISLGGGPGDSEQISIGGALTNSPGAQFNMTRDYEQASIGSLINQGSVSLGGLSGAKATVGSLVNSGSVYLARFIREGAERGV